MERDHRHIRGLDTWAAGFDETIATKALACFLALTSDAVLVLDDEGFVRLANDEAARTFGASLTVDGGEAGHAVRDGHATHQAQLVGRDVRDLVSVVVASSGEDGDRLCGRSRENGFEQGGGQAEDGGLPFSVDGSVVWATGRRADGTAVDLALRCTRLGGSGDGYLVVTRMADGDEAARSQNERLVEELSRANRRLSGTLKIILETIGSPDVSTLFSELLEELSNALDATGSIIYLAESDGFHLRGTSESLRGQRVPRFIAFGGSVEYVTARAGHAMRLRLLNPTGDDLRGGALGRREVMDETTREVYEVRARALPPFASMLSVPVWFGNRMVAIIEVGWAHQRATSPEDVDLLDAVTQYLSVQLAGALTALRNKYADELRDFGAQMRARLEEAGNVRREIGRVMPDVARKLVAELAPVEVNQWQPQTVVVELPEYGTQTLPVDLIESCGDGARGIGLSAGSVREGGAVVPVGEGTGLARWLEEVARPWRAVLVAVPVGKSPCPEAEGWQCWLLLRSEEDEPFVEEELSFLRHLIDDACEVERGTTAREKDKRISRALQTGMLNNLQDVRGVRAQGVYSSATESAFVGGDFYDLISLPERRACIIMGDVSGKGVEAASVSAAVKTALAAYAWEGLPAARMVALLNEFLLGFSRLETFATLFVGIIDLGRGTLQYCSAGHPPALLLRRGGLEGGRAEGGLVLMPLEVQSGVVGAFRSIKYRNGEVRLVEGDELLLYTDGTTEARARDGAFFGEDGLRDAVMSEVPKGFEGLCARLLGRLKAFTDGSLDDDVAMVALRIDAIGAREDGDA